MRGSDNIFADLGLPDAEEALVKAGLMIRLGTSIRRLKLTQKQVAERLGIDQPKVSALLNGRIEGFTADRLLRFLNALGHDVDIVVKTRRRSAKRRGRVKVLAA